MLNKNYLLSSLLFAAFFFAFKMGGHAQTKEVGLRLASFENFDFIYKKEKATNKLMRYRLGIANVGFLSQNDNESVSAQFGFAIGVENRNPINEEFYFIHGIEPYFSIALASSSNNTTWNLLPGVGYVLGFQYNLNEKFYINLETIPSLNVGISLRDNSPDTYAVNAGFNSNAISVTVAYRFTGKIR